MSVMGGKTDGVLGPGVGADEIELHATCVGTIMFVGNTKLGSGVGLRAVEQAVTSERRMRRDGQIKDLDVFMIIIF